MDDRKHIRHPCHMDMEALRKRIQSAVEAKIVEYKELSFAIGRNHAYIQQFVTRHSPQKLDRDDADLITDLAYMASRPELFTKKEMAAKMVEAAEVIATLRTLVGIRQEIELEDAEPEGNA